MRAPRSAHRGGRLVPGIAALGFLVMIGAVVFVAAPEYWVTGAAAETDEAGPGNTLGTSNDATIWRDIRHGIEGTVTIPDKKAAVLIQSAGQEWRETRNGRLFRTGAWSLAAVIAVLAVFYAVRGRIRLEGTPTGRLIMRFDQLDRLVHWTTAVSFVLLGLTGLNLLYGRAVLLPLIGPETFASLTSAGKYLHNYLGFLFMLGIFMMLVLWIRHNVPNRDDLIWLAKGGGMFAKGVHPPARKFNAGQKLIFVSVIGIGGLISYTGLTLLMPFTGGMTVQDMQTAQLLHSSGSLVLIAVIFAHIYIGTIGMEGAFDAMYSGKVDETWAREHHSLWVEELDAEAEASDTAPTPAE